MWITCAQLAPILEFSTVREGGGVEKVCTFLREFSTCCAHSIHQKHKQKASFDALYPSQQYNDATPERSLQLSFLSYAVMLGSIKSSAQRARDGCGTLAEVVQPADKNAEVEVRTVDRGGRIAHRVLWNRHVFWSRGHVDGGEKISA
jgi:hypothetical protein